MKWLTIDWQRLLSPEGQTCNRCAATQEEVRHAVDLLAEVLRPLDIEVKLNIRQLDPAVFTADPAESNRIWIDDRPLEDWIGASVGSSRCGSVCGESNCRTIELDGDNFETVPVKLILKAGLIAAANLVDEKVLESSRT